MKQEQQAIDAQYEKKRKGAEVAQKMYVSSRPYLLRPILSVILHPFIRTVPSRP